MKFGDNPNRIAQKKTFFVALTFDLTNLQPEKCLGEVWNSFKNGRAAEFQSKGKDIPPSVCSLPRPPPPAEPRPLMNNQDPLTSSPSSRRWGFSRGGDGQVDRSASRV